MQQETVEGAWVTEDPPAMPVANPKVKPLWEANL